MGMVMMMVVMFMQAFVGLFIGTFMRGVLFDGAVKRMPAAHREDVIRFAQRARNVV